MRRRRRKRVRGRWNLPEFSVEKILAWADRYFERTRDWPRWGSGAIVGAVGETWAKVDSALRMGHCGLSGGSSLAQLLDEQRGVRNNLNLPHLSVEQILAWADAHQARIGNWPQVTSGPILDAPGETWMAVNASLHRGQRGLPGGTTLADLLVANRGIRNRANLPRLTTEQVLAWGAAYHKRVGRWPGQRSGEIPEAPGETWSGVNTALLVGLRGLPGGSSLSRLWHQQSLPEKREDRIDRCSRSASPIN